MYLLLIFIIVYCTVNLYYITCLLMIRIWSMSWQVQTLLAGYHRLQVRIGLGCLQADTSSNCDDISGSPSQLLCRRPKRP